MTKLIYGIKSLADYIDKRSISDTLGLDLSKIKLVADERKYLDGLSDLTKSVAKLQLTKFIDAKDYSFFQHLKLDKL